jgi:hypothetical protein
MFPLFRFRDLLRWPKDTMDITYEMIAANVAGTRVDGNKIDVEWKCAASNRPMGRSEAYMAADYSVGNEVAAAVKRGVVREIGQSIARFLGGLIGGGAGRVLTDASHAAGSRVSQNVSTAAQYTEKSRRDAVVQAFAAVQAQLRWDEASRRFIAR